jgi:hypothetical protein
MIAARNRIAVFAAGALAAGWLAAVALQAQAPAQGRGQQPQAAAAPTGPLAPEKYKNIQVLTDVPADMVLPTMDYFVQATGIQCQGCHVQDQTTKEFAYEKDDNRTKQTARKMITLVRTVNAGDFGARIQCGTCHAGRNQPAGLQLALPMTDEQYAAMQAAQAAQAARQGGGGGAPGAGAPGAGRGQQGPPAPAVDDVIAKYVDAIGGQAAVAKLQSRTMTGTAVSRQRQSMPFTIEQKGAKMRQSIGDPATVTVFDGSGGWASSGTHTADLAGVALWSAMRNADLTLPLHIKDNYQLTAGRPRMLPGTQTTVNILQGPPLVNGTPVPNVTETFSFDATTGLLVRRAMSVRTPMGVLQMQTDYANYKDVGGVKMPFEIKQTTPQVLTTMTIADIKPNASIDDARFARPKGQ